MELNGGTLLARTLAEVTPVVFTLHGGHLDSFYQGCAEQGIELLDFRHEAAAVNAADAYARTTGNLGVAAITSGPGFANGFAGITHAYADGIPVLIIIGAPPLRETETRELQGGIDQIAAVRPVTKWAHRITNGERIPDLVGLAVRHAFSGRPGPVVLELPIDVAFSPINEKHLLPAGPPSIGSRPSAGAKSLREALTLLEGAQRPVAFVGEGSMWWQDREILTKFAEETRMPVFGGSSRRSLAPGHPLNGRDMSAIGALARSGGGAPDVALFIGFPQSMFSGGRPGPNALLPAETKIIQIDSDPADIGRIYPVDVAVVGDGAETLAAMLAAHEGPWPEHEEWTTAAATAWKQLPKRWDDAPREIKGRVHPYFSSNAVISAMDPGSILVMDGGETPGWVSMNISANEIDFVIGLGYQGHLGVGMGSSIGAQRAEPNRRVVQITGDGAIGFHVQELYTMVQHNLPIVTVVMANATWGMSSHGQDIVIGQRLISELADTPWEDVAKAFGAYGEFVDKHADIGPAVRRALDSGRPALIRVLISDEVVLPVTLAMLATDPTAHEIVVPYYRNIPLS